MEKPWYQPGRWYVSPYNFADEVVSQFKLPPERKVSIIDSTLRELEVHPGVKLRLKEQDILEIATKADEVGVAEMYMHPHFHEYLGTSTHNVNIEFERAFQSIAQRDFHFKLIGAAAFISGPSRGDWKGLIDRVAGVGPDLIEMNVILPFAEADARYYHLSGPPTTLEQIIAYMSETLDYAKRWGIPVRLSLADASKASFEDLIKVIVEAARQGVGEVELYDPNSSFSPEGMSYFMTSVRERVPQELALAVHVHEALGAASNVAIAAVLAGANGIDCSINGIEYRSGLARMEEVVCMLEMLYGLSTGIRLDKLVEYSDLVEEKSEIPVYPTQPVIGRESFLHEFALSNYAELLDRKEGRQRTLLPYSPGIVGNQAVLVWGANTLSPLPLELKLQELKLPYDQGDVAAILSIIEQRLLSALPPSGYFTEAEVESICRFYFEAGGKSR